MNRPVSILLLLAALLGVQATFPEPDKPLLLRQPGVSSTQIVFCYGGDLWIVGREGGDARRLTANPGTESGPVFSPDGSRVAFTGEYDGNEDVLVVPASGGVPQRLTFHPGPDEVICWTPDGKSIVFSSSRLSYAGGQVRLFKIPADGGFAEPIPLYNATAASFSPDGSRLAYVPIEQWQRAWKRYRGGQTKPIWLVNLADSAVEARIPRNNSNDFNPMWVGDAVYFLSDRNGPVSLFAYDSKSKQVKELVHNQGLDIKSAGATRGAIVYEQFGTLHLFDLTSGRDQKLDIRVTGDFTEVRPHFQKIEPRRIRTAAISPTGARAVFGVRGEILTVPAEKGDIRNLTNSVAIVERDPAWSPDGKSIAYMSDESGEYTLHIRSQNGMGEVAKIDLGKPPFFPSSPVWSPDSKKIAYTDKRLNLWYVEIEKKTPVRVDTDTYAGPYSSFDPDWSPDSRWLAYSRQLDSHLHAIFVHSLEEGKNHQLTDGLSDATHARFDHDGKYLYFLASTDVALRTGWLDMSSLARPVTNSVYLIVLQKDLPSPVAPESDEEKPGEAFKPAKDKEADKGTAKDEAKEGEKNEKPEKPVAVRIDMDQVGQRILALPIPARNYTQLAAGKTGELFVVEGPAIEPLDPDEAAPSSQTLHKFDLKTRKTEKILDEIGSFTLSFNGERMLYRKKDSWFLVPARKPSDEPPKPGEGGELKLDAMQVYVDPRAEWQHMYYQVWRDERDFFYDPGLHGLKLQDITKRYEPYLANIASREDLNYLFEEMLGEMTIGHMFIGGGDRPEIKKTKDGLLGADYSIENGRYRFARIFNGENWNPKLRAPLTQPGVNVTVGEYLIAVNGREVRAVDDVYSFFQETAGKQVLIKVGANPDGSGAREVTVVPVEDELSLRNLAWIEGNRRKVDELTGGRVAYVYLPNTQNQGYTNFNRYYFAQVGKQAAIIDERFNGGGLVADYIIDHLRRPLLNMFTMREGKDLTIPTEGIFGPKVMIINEMAGSGGDALPWMFRKSGIGPLIGARTWGGLVGHYDNPGDLLDGGFTGTPDLAFYTLEGKWDVENVGVAPDIEVEMDPKLVREGHDPQLGKAVEVILDMLKKSPPRKFERPPYPNYQQQPVRKTSS